MYVDFCMCAGTRTLTHTLHTELEADTHTPRPEVTHIYPQTEAQSRTHSHTVMGSGMGEVASKH